MLIKGRGTSLGRETNRGIEAMLRERDDDGGGALLREGPLMGKRTWAGGGH